jgi:type I restriction enzyme, S subunit
MIGHVAYWKNLERWVPFGASDWEAPHPLVPIGEVIRARREAVRAADFDLAQPITIHFDGSMELRDRIEAFKGSMFAAYPGDLVFSKIDVRNGAIGIVPDLIPKAVVTAEYPVYRHDPAQLDARFFALVVQSPHFLRTLKMTATGHSGRKRVAPETFEALEIPLPELEDQKRLVEAYFAELERAAVLEAEACAKEREALQNFEAELGLTPLPNLPRRLLQIARFSDMDRWSHEGILQCILLNAGEPQAAFDFVLLEDIAKVSYGLQKSPANRPGKNARPYLRVANVRRGELDLREIRFIEVPNRDMPKFRLEDGDILFVEGNGTLSELGRAAIWRGEIEDCIHQNHIIKARLDKRRADPEFVMEWFNTDAGRQHFFRNAKTTSGLGTLNSNDIRTAPLPLPPSLDEQRRIVWTLRETRRVAGEHRAIAGKVRTAAWGEFLAAVFE